MTDAHIKMDSEHKGSGKVWSQDEVSKRLDAAIAIFYNKDRYLLDAAASERSISHRLAVHLTNKFAEFDVDCEYNRDGFNVKKLAISEQNTEVSSESVEAITVFPDIVIHKRGSHLDNILVIEMKKWETRGKRCFDMQKLHAFKSDLHYQFAVFLALGIDDSSGQQLKCIKWI